MKHGVGKWSKISDDLAPRTDNQCKRQFELIEVIKKKKKIK